MRSDLSPARRVEAATADARRGRHARAARVLREAAWALARRGAGREGAAALATLGRLLLRRGRAREAAAAFEDAAGMAGSRMPGLQAWRALALAEDGRDDDARRVLETAAGSTADDTRWARLVGVRCAVVSGCTEGRLFPDDDLAQAWSALVDPEQRLLAGDTLVLAAVADGAVFDAGRLARSMIALASESGDPHGEAIAAGAHLAAVACLGDRVLVVQTLEHALRRARRAAAPIVAARARLTAGAAFERLGWRAGARQQQRHLTRLRAALPAAVRAALDRWLQATPGPSPARASHTPPIDAATLPGAIGTSEALAAVGRLAARAATVPFPVLIEGESGVGKELVARGIHLLGPRRSRAFCAVNCAAIPDELLDAELFGHARGAFTGAVAAHAGLFEAADGGTLFLDEVAELAPRAQARLLRVLQEGEVRRVGETSPRRIDVRVVAAANRDLTAEAAAGRFRADLLYRLDVIRIRVPPLRERREDVAVLVRAFWRDAAVRAGSRATLPDTLVAALCAHDWPGNVRELQNVIAALAVAAPASGRVALEALPARIRTAARIVDDDLEAAVAGFERRVIADALARTAGNRTRAASALGLTRQGLRKKMARLGLGAPVSGTRRG